MPQEMKKVNGRWVVTGSPQSSDLVPFVKPKAAAASPAAKPKPAAKPSAKPWWAKLGNDALYELKRLAAPPLQRNPLQEVQRAVTSPLARAVPQQIGLGVVGAVDNTNRMAYSLYQRHVQKKPKADPGAGRVGEQLDRYVDTAYRVLGATPPSQMSQSQREADDTRRSLALNAGLALIPGAGLGAIAAKTGLGTAVRGAGAFALNELASNYLDNNAGGNIVNLINQLSGAKLPGGVDVGNDDMIDAANKSLIPNTAAGVVLGGGVGMGASAFRNIQRRTRAGRQIEVVQRARAAQEDAGLIEKAEDGSYRFTEQAQQPIEPVKVEDVTPAPAQAAPLSPMDEFKAANAAMEEQLGMRPPEPAPVADTTESFGKAQPGELPEDDLATDPWDVEYDPALPESDALGRMVDELSDQELITIANNPGLPVVERVNQTIEARSAIEAPPPMSAQMVMAPTDRLADDYLERMGGALEAREDYQLRQLFDAEVNPQLWQRAQGLSGVDDPSQLSKADMLDTLRSLAAEGQTPITNRLMGAQMMATPDIGTAPLVFQYKGGTNEAGEQIGNSLEGLERWDPSAEGIIQVWRDNKGEIGPAGQVYVVNGHNRLAAARRMDIPSLRVEYLDAPTAAEARLQGAVANVSAGSGTVFDAAKLAREYGITDEAQLKALGKPGASGFWKDGIALGRLPEDVFTAAVNEQIPMRRAVIIGGSGGGEETMRSAYRYLVQEGPDSVTEGRLRQMMAMAARSPAPSSAAADQGDILKGTEWAQQFNAGMLAKADLATAIEQMLKREKKLFGTVGRSAGQIERVGQVDATAAKEISAEASRAFALFEQMKFETGPIGDLLNDNVSRVVSGQNAAEVARSMKNRLVAEIKQLMGQEVAPATDVVQEDMFAAAGRGADDDQGPIELAAEERVATKMQLLQQAISGQEVRPPSTPIPELPDAPRVNAAEAAQELALPTIDIPAAAARKLNPARERGNAESLYSWVNSGVPGDRQPIKTIEEAVDLLRAKNQSLDPDAIPGLDMDTARNDKAMGRSTPATEAVANAYRQFYGLPLPGPAIRPGSKAAQAMADEVRLAVEYGKADALNRWDQEEGLRDAFDYETRSFDEKKDLGAGAGYDEVTPTEVMPPPTSRAGKDIIKQVSDLEELIRHSRDVRLPAAIERGNTPITEQLQYAIPRWEKQLATLKAKYGLEPEVMPTEVMPKQSSTPIADAFAAQLRGMAESDARLFRTIGEMQQVTRQAIDELSGVAPPPVRPEPLRLTQGPEQPGFTLPKELSRSAPRYGRATISFASDLDRAAYTLANDAVKPSKAAPKFREAVEAAGLNVADVVAHGKRVKAAIKQAAGGGAAPQKAMELDIPAQPFGDAAKPPTKAGDIAVRQQIEANNQTMNQIRRKAQQEGC